MAASPDRPTGVQLAGRVLLITVFLMSLAINVAAIAEPQGAFDLLDWRLPVAMLAGWFAADLVSGIIHMVMDYLPCRTGVGLDRLYFYTGSRESAEYQAMFRATMAQLNPIERLVYDFKNHHPRPWALGRRTLWRQIGSTIAFITLPLSLLANLLVWLASPPGWLMAGIVTWLVAGTFAQYFHGTLHREDNPWIVRALRRVRLLMSPEAHDLHHATLTRDFSTNCGWSNPVLNRVFAFALSRGYLHPDGLEPARQSPLESGGRA